MFLFIHLCLLSATYGQDYISDEDLFSRQYDTPLTIDLEAIDEDEMAKLIELRKKKIKANVFYGKKTKKGFTKSGFGKDAEIEIFRYLKVYEEPDPYVRDVYWYSFKKHEIINSRKIDKGNAGILHGPYKKMVDEVVIEEGVYYKGVKHARWMKWNKHGILQSKEKYYKGWPKESQVAYYNRAEKQIKEIIPIHFGEKEGNYYAFHTSGNVAATGEFQFDNRVGTWKEFFDVRNARKREIVYPDDPFDKSKAPYISREWNESGKLIYDRAKK